MGFAGDPGSLAHDNIITAAVLSLFGIGSNALWSTYAGLEITGFLDFWDTQKW